VSRIPVTTHRVNGPALWRLLDAQRQARGLSWRGVARETRTTTNSLFTRLQHDDIGIHGDALVSLLVWLDRADDLRDIIRPSRGAQPPAGPAPTPVDVLVPCIEAMTVRQVPEALERCELMPKHGDHAGYQRHVRRGEGPRDCPSCHAGELAYRAQRRAARTTTKEPSQ
jgi:hypothetical protein